MEGSLIEVVKKSNNEKAKELIAQGSATANEADDDRASALHWAVYLGNYEIADFLIKNGANVNSETIKEKQTPLHWSCIRGSIQCVILLLKNGANLHTVDQKGSNAFIHAAQYGNTKLCYYLWKKGILISQKDAQGHNAAHWAAYFNHEETLQFLLKNGCSVNSTDNSGYTPLHLAVAKGNTKAVVCCLDFKADASLKDSKNNTALDIAKQKDNEELVKDLSKYTHIMKTYDEDLEFAHYVEKMPLLLFPGLMLVMQFMPLLAFLMMGVLGFIFAKKVNVGKYFALLRNRHKLWVYFFISGFICSAVPFFAQICWTMTIFQVFRFCFSTLILLLFYVYVCTSDPGVINEIRPITAEQLESMVEKNDDFEPICFTCNVVRPARSKHCRTCDHCVVRFDHHCVWLDTCIGLRNYRQFCVLLIFLIVMHSWFTYLCMSYITHLPKCPSMFNIFKFVYFALSKAPVVYVIPSVHIIFGLFEVSVFAGHLTQMLVNITTNESHNWKRYSHFAHPSLPVMVNPFDRGAKKNFMHYWFPDVDYYTFPQSEAQRIHDERVPQKSQEFALALSERLNGQPKCKNCPNCKKKEKGECEHDIESGPKQDEIRNFFDTISSLNPFTTGELANTFALIKTAHDSKQL